MCKASAISDATGPDYNKMDNTGIDSIKTNIGIIDDDIPRDIKSKIDIVAREKQTNATCEVYYLSKQE